MYWRVIVTAFVTTSLAFYAVSASAYRARATQERLGQLETFTRTAEGDWRTVITSPGGQTVEYVYVPKAKVTPRIRTTLTVIDPKQGRIKYSYRIENAASGKQQLAVFWLGPPMPPVTFTRIPDGWTAEPFLGTPTVIGPPRADGFPSGIAPGGVEIVELEAQNLPGVVQTQSLGDVPQHVTVPEYLTDQQQDELSRISEETVSARALAIGPVIPAGVNTPGMSINVLALRVARHYHDALEFAQHPYAGDMAAAFERLVGTDSNTLTEALKKLKELTLKPVTDPWHQDLSAALGVCVDLMLNGDVPVR